MKTRVFKKNLYLLILILSVSLFAACGNPSKLNNEQDEDKGTETSFPVKITDVLGRTVEVEKEPERIVSIAPNSTETLFELGLGDKIVGVSEQCDYPEAALSKEQMGAFWQPNLEKIVDAQPDLVFVGNSIPADVMQKLEEMDIKVASLEAVDFEGTYQTILDTGRLTGAVKMAEDVVQRMKDTVGEIQKKIGEARQPSCYFIVSHGSEGNFTAGPGSFIHEMIAMAGGRNIAEDLEQPWAEFSLERLVEEDPEVVIISSHANSENIKDEEGYKELTAIQRDNLKVVEDNLVVRPGPRLVEGLEQIAKAIHPELFK